MLRTEAVKKLLSTGSSIAKLYTPEMEVQVNVAQGVGEKIEGNFPRPWHGWTDGLTTWKAFRIPWNAAKNPRYTDREIKFDLSIHACDIGMTGWNYQAKQSLWVGFDFDSIIGHKQGLSDNELKSIQNELKALDYIQLITSTSGLGIHVYVYLSPTVTKIENHTEHAAVARAILNKICTKTGLNLQAKVDTLGGNMWVWSKRASEASFAVLKASSRSIPIPTNWRDYLSIVDRSIIVHSTMSDSDRLAAAQYNTELTPEHKRLIDWFEKQQCLSWWDNEKGMLVCHTYDLKRAHRELKLNGLYDTLSTGRQQGADQNCFCFPESDGSWVIRRHSKGVTEHEYWYRDSSGWTTIRLGTTPSFRQATTLTGGIEGDKDYNFKTLKAAIDTLELLGITLKIDERYTSRSADLRKLGDRVQATFPYVEGDPDIAGWIKKGKKWQRFFRLPNDVSEDTLPDDIIRHVVVTGIEVGWFINTNNQWIMETKHNLSQALISLGFPRAKIDTILGQCVLKNWILVTKPFKPEYTGNREWNKNAPQFRFNPKRGKHPTWDLILNHLGENLSDRNYLQTWVASLFQYPSEPLPYLTFTGPQNCGKSIFHESLSLLFTRGYIRADNSLTNPSGFNGELANAILCVVEETNLSTKGHAGDRIKDWVTGRTISIRALYKQSYDVQNYTHWVQCTNDTRHCPVFPGDTRIVLINVPEIAVEIPKPELLERCEKEAPYFLHTILNIEIPESKGRLRIPVLDTDEKLRQQEYNEDDLTAFIREHFQDSKEHIPLSVAYSKFLSYVDNGTDWSSRRFSRELGHMGIKKGRHGAGGQMHILERKLR